MSAPSGWTCPKCGRVWAPSVIECGACNKGLAQSREYIEALKAVPQPDATTNPPYGTWHTAPWSPWVVWCETRGETQ